MEPPKKDALGKKIISQLIFEAMCGLGANTTIILAIESYNIAVAALYIRLSIAVESDC